MHIAPGYPAGDARLFHLECFSLKKAGYHVELIAHSTSEDKAGSALDFNSIGSSLDFRSLGPLGSPSWGLRVMERLRRSQRAYVIARQSQAALYHIHSPEFITYGIRLKKSGRKIVFDFREDFESYVLQRPGIPSYLRNTLAFGVRKQLESAARNSDAVIVADEGTAKRFKGHARRTVVLHNFPRPDLFPYREVREDEKSFDIVYHGGLPKYYMDLCLRIDAALVQQGTQIRWRFITKGSPDMDWFQAELARAGALHRFTIDGLVPHEQIASEVCKARIGIILLPNLPKFQSNIPRKVFEFMALGMPVVLSDLPPTRPFVRNGDSAFLVPPGDCKAYADAITVLIRNPNLRQEMGAAGRRLVQQEYNWDKESQKLLGLYTDLLSN